MPNARMRLLRPIVATALVAISAPSFGTAQRTFVSATGLDANPCSVTAPCRSFGAAIMQTTAGGEVIVLDSGGYGPVTIDKAVSITAPAGVYAGVSVFNGTGIVVNPASGVVILTGLTLSGLGGATGIDYQSGSQLRLNNVMVSGFTAFGLSGHLSTSGEVAIRDSTFFNDGMIAIDLSTSSGTLAISMQGMRVEANTFGINLTDNVFGVIADTIIRRNFTGAGFIQASSSGSSNKVTVLRCVISGNLNGLALGSINNGSVSTIEVVDSEFSDNTNSGVFTETYGTAYFSNTKITRNGTGIDISTFGGSAISFGDNLVYANGGGEVFSSTLDKK